MGDIVLAGATSGTTTLTPTFSAYSSGNQNITSATYTKIALQTEEFDTNSNFDNATNYRFTPTVAGYYQINGQGYCAGTAVTYATINIYKNGSLIKIGSTYNGAAISEFSSSVSSVVYCNGSTDYVELYAFIVATASPRLIGGASFYTYFSGALVRAA